MNENLNLVEILKDCPEGTKLYSPIIGEVEFKRIKYSEYPIVTCSKNGNRILLFTKEGLFFSEGECIMLFPSKDQRDWSKFKIKKPKFDPKTLQPFDRVLVRDYPENHWRVEIFGCITEEHKCICTSFWKMCIPYNDETKNLLGTKEDCPEYYKWWDE